MVFFFVNHPNRFFFVFGISVLRRFHVDRRNSRAAMLSRNSFAYGQ